MSSIDKGVERVAHQMNSRIKVEHRGTQIVGVLDGEVIFRVDDRYGYINSDEERQVRQGYANYQRIQELNRLRAEEEARRREAARVNAINDLNNQISRSLSQVQATKQSDLNAILNTKNKYTKINSKIQTAQKTYRLFDISALEKSANNLISEVEKESLSASRQYDAVINEINRVRAQVNSNLTIQQADAILSRFRKINKTVRLTATSEYQYEKLATDVDNIVNKIQELNKSIALLEQYSRQTGEVGMTATGVINGIKTVKISSVEDVQKVASNVHSGLKAIQTTLEIEGSKISMDKALELEQEIIASRELGNIEMSSTHEKHDYRNVIVSKAKEVSEAFDQLANKEFTTCGAEQLENVQERLRKIVLGKENDYATVLELEDLLAKSVKIEQDDKLYATDYANYLKYRNKLLEYGYENKDIPAFTPASYEEVIKNMKAAVAEKRREEQKTQMHMTQIATTEVMEEMGYEVFSRVGDPKGFVAETLFTKRGCEGVLWQIICLSDGSHVRRIIGVRSSEGETSIEQVKEVAKQMDESNESLEFINRFRQKTGSNAAVTAAIEHDSPNVDEVIRQQGYHEMPDEVFKRFKEKTQIQKNTAATRGKQIQGVYVTLGSTQAGDSRDSVNEAFNQSLQMSMKEIHEN